MVEKGQHVVSKIAGVEMVIQYDLTELSETTPLFLGQEDLSMEEREEQLQRDYREYAKAYNNQVLEIKKKRKIEYAKAERSLGSHTIYGNSD